MAENPERAGQRSPGDGARASTTDTVLNQHMPLCNAQSVKSACSTARRPGFDSPDGKIPWKEVTHSKCSCLQNPLDRGACGRAIVHGGCISQAQLRKLLSFFLLSCCMDKFPLCSEFPIFLAQGQFCENNFSTEANSLSSGAGFEMVLMHYFIVYFVLLLLSKLHLRPSALDL